MRVFEFKESHPGFTAGMAARKFSQNNAKPRTTKHFFNDDTKLARIGERIADLA